jgi:hypothetical protein
MKLWSWQINREPENMQAVGKRHACRANTSSFVERPFVMGAARLDDAAAFVGLPDVWASREYSRLGLLL